MGTLLEIDSDGISMVKWDPYMNTECQVTLSGAHADDLELVGSLHRCDRPTRPGMYLCKRGVDIRSNPEVCEIVDSRKGLYVSFGVNGVFMDDLESTVLWWGPFVRYLVHSDTEQYLVDAVDVVVADGAMEDKYGVPEGTEYVLFNSTSVC